MSRYNFCLVIMANDQSEMNGIELVKALRQIRPVPILVLSSEPNSIEKITAFRAGAQAYLEKPYNLEECLAYAQSLIELYICLREDESQRNILTFDKNLLIDSTKRQTILMGKLINLTRKEFDLLFYLASHVGQVLSREQIYRAVWKEDSAYNVDESVKSHIKSLRRKLLPSGKEFIKNEWGVGYRFSPEDEK